MSDNLRRYRAIRQALKQGYPGEPSGRLAQHLTYAFTGSCPLYETLFCP